MSTSHVCHKNLSLFFGHASVAVQCQAASKVCAVKTHHYPAKFWTPVSVWIEVKLLRPVNLGTNLASRLENNFPLEGLHIFWENLL